MGLLIQRLSRYDVININHFKIRSFSGCDLCAAQSKIYVALYRLAKKVYIAGMKIIFAQWRFKGVRGGHGRRARACGSQKGHAHKKK